ncbi:uncharacterized protein LY89DRAFT_789882 [Mollisia scopiformis]|uniref:Amino acid transporter transmembrane domain-containing protein n=1 Tax=Mollisia scopiformis TaxID=149040 RepID=A0A132B420_MOLSC|nr:uncharacterized protein LY89DRAFT_789882 [Mollisia scopiformis]KUJ07081.1 hypothetical protein LY89DRAFT_789882 [Mollisia scopiformis]
MALQEIGFYGGMALLISSITGPGLTTIPLLYQEAGWLTPTLAFVLFGCLAGITSLFLVETMSTIHGNEAFQARVEFSTVAHLYLGDKAHIIMQVLLYCALQSVNVSSIIISEQTMDSLLIQLFHKSCALSFTKGWVCVSSIDSSGLIFDSYILFSFGYLIAAAMVLPLSVMSLVQNIKFQLISVATLFFVMIVWIFLFASHGLDLAVPAIGHNQSALVGFTLSNFAFLDPTNKLQITTVPSFINELSRRVSIRRSIAYPIVICVALYIIIGLTGAASFQIDPSSDLLATLSAAKKHNILIIIVNILFPISVLVTSVPVFAIVIRYNLVRGNLCSNRWAIVWASLIPWVLIIPFQTKGWLVLVMNWSSLIFGSSTNFIIPLTLYISSKTHTASTIDTSGGDLFVLHRENASKKSNEAIDVADLGQESSSSGLDPSSIPLRVVYSPAVSRNPSIGHGSQRGTAISNSDLPSESTEEILIPSHLAPNAPSLEAQRSSEGHTLRRRSSTASRDNTRSSYQPSSNPNAPPERSFSQERDRDEEHIQGVFKALPRRKWLPETLLARICLAIVTCCVLGNLIYTIVETARGHSPLSG